MAVKNDNETDDGEQPCPVCGEPADELIDGWIEDAEVSGDVVHTEMDAIGEDATIHAVEIGQNAFLHVHYGDDPEPLQTGAQTVVTPDGTAVHAREHTVPAEIQGDVWRTPCGQRGNVDDVEIRDTPWSKVSEEERCSACEKVMEAGD